MASLMTDRSGKQTRYAIQFTYGQMPDGRSKRNTLRLGPIDKKYARSAQRFIEDLLAARIGGRAVTQATLEWLRALPLNIHQRLERVGLVDPAESTRYTLQSWFAEYFAGRSDWKPSTREHCEYARRDAEDFFGGDTPLAEITQWHAEGFRRHLKAEKGLAENTLRRRCGRVRQFFAAAIKKKIISENPFDGIPTRTLANTSRYYFVSHEEATAVLDACPDVEWRLIFALCRYGGLRCPSEVLRLAWRDIDWDKGRFTVRATKTEHHEGGGVRTVPIFAELRPYLQEAFDQAEPGAKRCIRGYLVSTMNLRTRLKHIIETAGLKVWPKLFQNLRSTRETELAETYPIHVVTSWLGNSPEVAKRHYLQTTEEHFQRATGEADQDRVKTIEASKTP
jgi:integrase